jgi:hypothetical protein
MFKKIIIAAISASFVASAAFADSTNIGVRISAANLEASGTETTDQATTINQAAKNSDFALPSIFIERSIDLNSDVSVSLGLDYVPLTAEVSAINSGTGVDADIKAGNLVTAYIQPSYLVQENVRVFGKIGYAQGDLKVDNITRTANLDGETAPTDTGADKTLEGPVYGVGIQVNRDGGVFNFIRLEATHTDFDKVTHTNSNGKVLTADAEMDLVTLTIGKSF